MDDTSQPRSSVAATQRPDLAHLFLLASEQKGHFTAQQAHGSGISRALLSHYARRGRFIRVRHGLYRLRDYPSSSHEEVLAAWLTVGRSVAVVSHESALDLLGLSDVIPDAVHLTIPRAQRRRVTLPGVTVHTSTRPPKAGERVVRDGIVLTSPTRTILDAAEGGVAPEQVEAAVIQAIQRGLTTAQELHKEARDRNQTVQRLIAHALDLAMP